MPWRDLTVARACNRCRRVLSAGAHVYQGDITGATWCADCAGTLGMAGERPIATNTMNALASWIRQMQEKHTRRDLSARILGEGEE